MSNITIRRQEVSFLPQNSRVIVRPFIPFHAHLVGAIAGRANALSESEAEAELAMLEADFSLRHLDIEAIWLNHFQKVRASILPAQIYSRTRQLLIGAMFSGEYALESAALFNPSMVPHPDQTDAPAGGVAVHRQPASHGRGTYLLNRVSHRTSDGIWQCSARPHFALRDSPGSRA